MTDSTTNPNPDSKDNMNGKDNQQNSENFPATPQMNYEKTSPLNTPQGMSIGGLAGEFDQTENENKVTDKLSADDLSSELQNDQTTNGIPSLSSDSESQVADLNKKADSSSSSKSDNKVDMSKKHSKKVPLVLMTILVVLIGLVVGVFFLKSSDKIVGPFDSGNDDSDSLLNNAPKQYTSPLNGMYFSNEEADKFKNIKPIAVMVNNHPDARPSAGISSADVVYEAVAEGGVTRLMPIFWSRLPEKVSSLRSARYYFAELAAGYKAEYFHWGAAHIPPCQKLPQTDPTYCGPIGGKLETNPEVDAYDRIVKLGLANLDGGNYACDGNECAFGRDPNKVGKVATEHTALVRPALALDLAKKIRPEEKWHTYIPVQEWKFKEDAPLQKRGDIGQTSPIEYNYWDMPSFQVKWVYDKNTNEYTRYQGGVKQIDELNGQDIKAKAVIIRFTEEQSAGDRKSHMMYKLVGTGDVLIFQDGNVIKGKWSNSSVEERDIYTDLEGNQLELNRGQIWVQIVPLGKNISYSQSQETSPETDTMGIE